MKDGSDESKDKTAEEKVGFFERLHNEWLEIIATFLLALATIATAWCAYQAARWSSREALRFNEATAARVHASEAADLADIEMDIDVEAFFEYLAAQRAGDSEEVQYIERDLFRDEMKDAVDAWIATDPMNNAGAYETPFDMPQYVNANREEARRLEAEASAKVEEAKKAIQISDFYVMLTVLFASVLFFMGICTKFKGHGIRIAILSIGTVLFIFSLVVMFTQPVL